MGTPSAGFPRWNPWFCPRSPGKLFRWSVAEAHTRFPGSPVPECLMFPMLETTVAGVSENNHKDASSGVVFTTGPGLSKESKNCIL